MPEAPHKINFMFVCLFSLGIFFVFSSFCFDLSFVDFLKREIKKEYTITEVKKIWEELGDRKKYDQTILYEKYLI